MYQIWATWKIYINIYVKQCGSYFGILIWPIQFKQLKFISFEFFKTWLSDSEYVNIEQQRQKI